MKKNLAFIFFIFISLNRMAFSMNNPLHDSLNLIEVLNNLSEEIKILTELMPNFMEVLQELSDSINSLSLMGYSYNYSVNEALLYIKSFVEIANSTVKNDIPKIISLGEEYQQIGLDVGDSLREAVLIANQTIFETIPRLQDKYDPFVKQVSELANIFTIGFCILAGVTVIFTIIYSGHKIVKASYFCYNNYKKYPQHNNTLSDFSTIESL